jgi:hypothetical protein
MSTIFTRLEPLILSVLAAACSAVAADNNVIYRLDLQNGPGAEWSDGRVEPTPSGRNLLGQFGAQTNFLTLGGLGPHTNLVVSLDLAILRSWDGNGNSPDDIWEIRLVSTDGSPDVPLFQTTFSQNRNNGAQWFPNARNQGSPSLARTGASELDSLGFFPAARDSIYPVSISFPHVGETATLAFVGLNLQAIADESWAIVDLVVGHGPAPTVSLKNVVNDLAFLAPANINVEADVRGENIARVDFLTNGVVIGSRNQAPYTITLTNVAAGVIPIMARAFTTGGLHGQAVAAVIVNGLSAEYFDATNFQGANVSRVDPFVNYLWDTHAAVPGIAPTSYSVRWTGYLIPEYSEPYTIFVSSDDGARLWIDSVRVIDEWRGRAIETNSVTVPLTAGRRYAIQMDYYNGAGDGAKAKLQWFSPSVPKQMIPQSALEPFLTPTNHPPNRPVVLEPNRIGNPVITSDTLVLRVDDFSDPDKGQTNAATDWEIWTVNPAQRIWSSPGATGDRRLATTLRNGVFENSHAGRTNLVANLSYVLKVRHKDSSGSLQTAWSQYSERHFDTIDRSVFLENTFNNDVQGWTTWDNVPPYNAVDFTDTGGRSGGGIRFSETREDGAISYWLAPLSFLGEKTAMYGGVLSFDLRQENTANPFDAPDVIFEGGGLSLVFNLPSNPSPTWTSYTVPLTEEADWRVGSLEGLRATKTQMLSALGDLTRVLIRGEYNSRVSETNSLDNVKLTGRAVSEDIALNAAFVEANVELSWPILAADFVVEQREFVDQGEWRPVEQPRTYEESRVSLRTDFSSQTQFFRLRKAP